MNPDTKTFEELKEQLDEKKLYFGKLLKPDGRPVPDTWLICGAGDLVTVERNNRSFTFRVAYVGEKVLVLEPADPIVGSPQEGKKE
jgi:hypothetical protein